MSKATKIWIITATSLIFVGCMILVGIMTMLKWDFTKLQTAIYETNEYDINESYKNISITTDTADIVFIPAENEKHSVTCYEQKNIKHSVFVKDSTLVIEVNDIRKWYEYLGIAFTSPKITVNIPQGEYGSVSVKSSTGSVVIPKGFEFERMDIWGSTGNIAVNASVSDDVKTKNSTGNIRIDGITAKSLELCVSTGEITVSDVVCTGDIRLTVSTGKTALNNIKCNNLTSLGSTGNIFLNNVIAQQKLSIKRSTGDITFDSSDAAEIFAETDTGDIVGSLLADKVFIAHTDTGSIDVPQTVTGGKCQITTDTGDIKIKINKSFD